MPTYKGLEVWIEDSEYRKLDHQGISIDLVDERTITAQTEMLRDELYTVHCRSPISVFCEVFVISSSRIRKRAARFHLDKSLVMSKDALGSSIDHTEGEFKTHGIRTPKRKIQGNLGSVEVEVRRVDGIVKGEPQEEYDVDRSQGSTEFCMIDDFSQPAWLVFRFDIGVKQSLPTLQAACGTTEYTKRHVPHRMRRNHTLTKNASQQKNSCKGSGSETSCRSYEYSHIAKKYPKHSGSGGVAGNQMHIQLQKEYAKEEAEERRLLQKLQEQLQTKKASNMELRRLLGETT